MRAVDGGVGRIVRNQPDMAVILAERLDRGLVIQQCGDDIAILRAVLLADHHEITIANGGVDHGITVHFKHEQIAGAGKPFGKPHHIIDMLLGRDRHAGGDAPDQWNVMRGHDGAACIVLTGERDDLGEIIPIKDQLKNNMNKYIGVSVSLPLFSGLSRLTDVRKERFRLQRIRNENEQQRLSLYKEIDDACLSLRAAAEEHRQAVEQLRTSTVTLKESEEKWEEGMISEFELMEKRNLYILAKAELSRTRLQYELKSRTVDFYRTGSFLGTE